MEGANESTELWAVVIAQLVERSLPKAVNRGSNPIIGSLHLVSAAIWELIRIAYEPKLIFISN